ncbi:hypothetical protein GALMADRAFT_249596 [Galerina marginata CBS 339.88]|uniref:Uncharacterized protein n=1 Tax=Galerina marginata (strain CBS 339.88) TaxID=685588 RepID=A0A067SXA0_GALM3|nr:hypothetical protein GALMADRAFT_249596 [Galerina marginata CBS 339.88]
MDFEDYAQNLTRQAQIAEHEDAREDREDIQNPLSQQILLRFLSCQPKILLGC